MPTSTSAPPFHDTYHQARASFLGACAASYPSADVRSIELAGARAPDGSPLVIDVVSVGDPSAPRVLLHSSGVHGVEGFAGSAIQVELLRRGLVDPPPGCRVVFVHAVNPYGMAHWRRVNERNVDLNRNFLAPGERYEGAPKGYASISPIMNPSKPVPGGLLGFVFFVLAALLHIVTWGMARCKQALQGGQYEVPRGLCYGGAELEESGRRIVEVLRELGVADAERVFHIDVHTGLGPWAHDTLLLDYGSVEEFVPIIGQQNAARLEPFDADGMSYITTGAFTAYLPALLRDSADEDVYQRGWRSVTQEFGTLTGLWVVSSLRSENALHHNSRKPVSLEHPIKQQLLRAFYPLSASWRSRVLDAGIDLFVTSQRSLPDMLT